MLTKIFCYLSRSTFLNSRVENIKSMIFLAAILDFEKRSRVHRVHPADSERVDLGLPKSIKKRTLYKISGFSTTSAGLLMKFVKSRFYCSSEIVICRLFDYFFMDLDDIHTLYVKFTPGHFLFFACHANVNRF